MCRYIVGYTTNGKVLMLPTLPQLLDSLSVCNTFPDPDDIYLDVPKALEVVSKQKL